MQITPAEEPKRTRRVTGAKNVAPMEIVRMHMADLGFTEIEFSDKEDFKDFEDEAVSSLMTYAEGHAAFARHFIEQALRAAVRQIVGEGNKKRWTGDETATLPPLRQTYEPQQTTPKPFLSGSQPPLANPHVRLRIKARQDTLDLLQIVLPNRIRLAFATEADLVDASSRMRSQGRDMLHKSSFYDAVRKSLPAGKRVSEVMDNVVLTNLWRQTELTE